VAGSFIERRARMSRFFGAVVILALLLGVAHAGEVPHARVSTGELSGVRQVDVAAFLGVPFAAPPVGDLRWRAPRPPLAWAGVRSADRFGPSCLQVVNPAGLGPWKHEYVVQGAVSEDCLFLNVWTPAPAGAHLPVLVWIHGGAFTSGSGSVPIYNGAILAAQGVVVVTINYRLGIWGFLAHPDLTREAGNAAPANFGLQDILAALRWVQGNINAFGGDPTRVTIAGQSAGSMAVHDLLVSPLAKGLFAQAISESGLPTTIPIRSLKEAEADGVAFVRSKGAADIVALRAMSAVQLAADAPTSGIGPAIDGVLLPDSPIRLISAGRFNDTPVLIGLNADEGSSHPSYGVADPAAFNDLFSQTYGELAQRFAALYPARTDAERLTQSRAVSRDNGLMSVYVWARARQAQSHRPLYAYLNTYTEPGPDSARYLVFHSSEIPYVFGTLDTASERGFVTADFAHSEQISGYWLSFITHGDPNGDHRPRWPEFNSSHPEIMELGPKARPRPFLPPAKLQAQEDFVAHGGSPRMF
jgi:para-nitrobenzyl esterase